VIHRIIYEPRGGAHRDPAETAKRLTLALRAELDALSAMTRTELRREREEFFLKLG
jgi:acetyl-CoA carboxylase carboxyl transferase subunit alpha